VACRGGEADQFERPWANNRPFVSKINGSFDDAAGDVPDRRSVVRKARVDNAAAVPVADRFPEGTAASHR